MKKKVISKGYTVEVTSWENDGDNYRTKTCTYETLEEASAVKHMCDNLFQACYDEETVGNKMWDEMDECDWIIVKYFIKHPYLLLLEYPDGFERLKPQVEEDFKEYLDASTCTWLDCLQEYLEDKPSVINTWANIVKHYKYNLLGSSEYYYSRHSESCEVYYSPEDIYLTKVL